MSLSKLSAVCALCCCSVTQSCPALCDPMDCSKPGFPALHQSVMPCPSLTHGICGPQNGNLAFLLTSITHRHKHTCIFASVLTHAHTHTNIRSVLGCSFSWEPCPLLPTSAVFFLPHSDGSEEGVSREA